MSETPHDRAPDTRDPNAEPAARYRGGPTPLRTVAFGPFEMHPWVFPGAATHLALSAAMLERVRTPRRLGLVARLEAGAVGSAGAEGRAWLSA